MTGNECSDMLSRISQTQYTNTETWKISGTKSRTSSRPQRRISFVTNVSLTVPLYPCFFVSVSHQTYLSENPENLLNTTKNRHLQGFSQMPVKKGRISINLSLLLIILLLPTTPQIYIFNKNFRKPLQYLQSHSPDRRSAEYPYKSFHSLPFPAHRSDSFRLRDRNRLRK